MKLTIEVTSIKELITLAEELTGSRSEDMKTVPAEAEEKPEESIETTAKIISIELQPEEVEQAPEGFDMFSPDEGEKAPELKDVRNVTIELKKAKGVDTTKELIAKHGGTKASDIPQENYSAYIEEARKLIEE